MGISIVAQHARFVPELSVAETDLTVAPHLTCVDASRGEIDDIDHLGNRRLRTIDELASEELRKGFLKLRRTVQERMSLKDQEDMTPRSLINPKSISAAIDYFFGRGELSQVVMERLDRELGVINKLGFPNYFLIVWDFINHAKSKGIPVGPGRGSGAGEQQRA